MPEVLVDDPPKGPKRRKRATAGDPVLVTGPVLAVHLDLTPQRIARLAEDRIIERRPDGRFDQDQARVFYLRWLRDPVRRSVRTEAAADHVRAKTAMLELKLAERKRRLTEWWRQQHLRKLPSRPMVGSSSRARTGRLHCEKGPWKFAPRQIHVTRRCNPRSPEHRSRARFRARTARRKSRRLSIAMRHRTKPTCAACRRANMLIVIITPPRCRMFTVWKKVRELAGGGRACFAS